MLGGVVHISHVLHINKDNILVCMIILVVLS